VHSSDGQASSEKVFLVSFSFRSIGSLYFCLDMVNADKFIG